MTNSTVSMGPAFNEKTISRAKPQAKPYEIRDSGDRRAPGLLLRVHPSGKKTYYCQIKRGVRVALGSAPKMTLDQARTEARQKMGQSAAGVDVQAESKLERLTLGKFIDGKWSQHAKTATASFEDMKRCVKLSFADLLAKPMAEITELDMRRWRKTRNKRTKKDGTPRKPVSLETMKRELTYLRAILNFAVAEGDIPAHQIRKYKVIAGVDESESEQKIRYLTADEEQLLRTQLDKRERELRESRVNGNKWRQQRGKPLMPVIKPNEFADHIKPLVLLALNTGLRRGDLFDLKWSHVDLDKRQVRKVISKSSHARRKAGKPIVTATLPLSAEAHAILQQLHRQRDPASELVFPSPLSGTRLDNIKKGFTKLIADAGIADFRFHDLRHTFASRLVMAGVDINTVRELMTHSDIKMTLIYAHLSPDHKAAALEKAFGAAP